MSKIIENIKEDSILILQNAFYHWNKCKNFDCAI